MKSILTMWEPPESQEQKLCNGEGACMDSGVAARVSMRGERDFGYLNEDGFDSYRASKKHGTTRGGKHDY